MISLITWGTLILWTISPILYILIWRQAIKEDGDFFVYWVIFNITIVLIAILSVIIYGLSLIWNTEAL